MLIDKIAIQMDDIDSIDLKFDTTLLLALEAQNRGFKIFYYNPENLESYQGLIQASGFFIEFFENKIPYYKYLNKKRQLCNLNDFEVVLIRQDPPFNMNYITSTYLLEQLDKSTIVLNNPTSIRNAAEKIYPFRFQKFIPPTIITQSIDSIKNFLAIHEDIVTKPLYGNAGEGIFRTKNKDKKINGINTNLKYLSEPLIIQKYIPEITQGDRRIILIDGEYCGSVSRIPQLNNLKANFHAGGKPEKVELIKRDKEICEALKKDLKDKNLFLVGIDIIGDYLTEINVTSPTGLIQINKLNNVNLEKIFWDKVVEKFF